MRYFSGKKEYTFIDGKNRYTFQSETEIPQGSLVEVEGEINGDVINTSLVIILEGKEADDAYQKIKNNVQIGADAPSLLKDEVTEKLWPQLKEAARKLICARKLGRMVLLRFHGDADGVCGAFAINEVVRCKSYQQNAVVYSVRDALRDISGIGQETRPLIILLDFGSSDQSLDGLKLLEAAGIEYMIIDHHPPGKEVAKRAITPFSVTDNGSKYCAGYLASEIAVACGMEIEKAMGLAATACSGDKSNIIEHGEKEVKKALVLDFLAAHTSFGNNLEFYKNVMDKAELFYSISNQAEEAIDEAVGKVRIKETKEGDLNIVHFALENIVKKGEWPPAGKITTRIFEGKMNDGPLVVIGYNERTLILRLNAEAEKMGLGANLLAEEMQKCMGDFVEGGGGHIRAGAIRVREGFAKEVLNQLIEKIKKN
ncbi:hypothetical protein KKE38_03625 [Candidatus Micrarchaeota archaeon]|nr:hypothetical protein [Candidatus Micrarchaeota archaeon]